MFYGVLIDTRSEEDNFIISNNSFLSQVGRIPIRIYNEFEESELQGIITSNYSKYETTTGIAGNFGIGTRYSHPSLHQRFIKNTENNFIVTIPTTENPFSVIPYC